MESIKKFIDACDPRNEIELRFNDHKYDGLKYATFQNILNQLSKNSDYKLSKSKDKVISGKNGRNEVRAIISNNNYSFQKKNRKLRPFLKSDFYFISNEYNIKMTESYEQPIILTPEEFMTTYTSDIYEKDRERYSFMHKSGIYQIDMTISLINNSKRKFELELEYLKMKDNTQMKDLENIAFMLLKMIQNTDVYLKMSDINTIIRDYKTLLNLNKPKFYGPLPYTLSFENIDKIACGYSVTDKADGERFQLFIDNNGHSFLISRNLIPKYIGKLNHKNYVYDGELINNNFYIFDVIVSNKINVQDLPLDKRLKYADTFNTASIPNGLSIKLFVKKFYFTDIFLKSKEIWSNRSSLNYTLDGLIFTPINKPYINEHIYKWKPKNTIDFFVKKTDGKFKLHIAGTKNNEYQNLEFGGFDNKGTFINRFGKEEYNKLFSSQHKSGIIDVSEKLFNKFPDNSVIEFEYKSNNFIPFKERPDKEMANSIGPTNDAWDAIKEPITITKLSKPEYVSCIRNYHNKIKDHLIEYYMKNKSVLDIGSGAGGDIGKYIKHKASHVTGVDIVNVEYEHPDNMKFYKVTNELYSIKNIIKKDKIKKFDVINIQFAVHYFFKNQETLNNFVTNITENIKDGGLLVMTFMDGSKIDQLLKNTSKNKVYTEKFGTQKIFSITKNYSEFDKLTGTAISVKLFGTKYFDSNITEYLINCQRFIELLEQYGFKLQYKKSFAEYSSQFPYEFGFMNSIEKSFSSMNISLIFKLH